MVGTDLNGNQYLEIQAGGIMKDRSSSFALRLRHAVFLASP